MSSSPSLEDLYDDHAQALFAFLLNFLRHASDAKDVLQELFIKIARKPDLLGGVRDHRAFLLRLAHNLAIDLMRRRESRERVYDRLGAEPLELFAQEVEPDEAEFRMKMAEALGELPAEQRAVIYLRVWEGLTFDVIAELLGVPLNTAASRYRYGIDKLRERLRPLIDEMK